MPTIRTIKEAISSNENIDYAGDIVATYPYKEYDVAKESDGSIVVACPDGSRMRMPKSAIEYYSRLYGDGMASADDYDGLLPEIDGHSDISDLTAKTKKLKEISRRFAGVEHNPESYSPASYVMSQPNMDPNAMKSIYGAWASGDASGLDAKSSEIYSKALSYAFSYYKFLLGLFSILGKK